MFLAVFILVIWLYLTLGRGDFWRVDKNISRPAILSGPVKIVAVVPARNEAEVIEQSLDSLFAQELLIPIHVIVVDDNSSDGTALIASAAAEARGVADRLTIIHGSQPPYGWTGKLWALQQGIDESRKHAPDYVLLTDADIFHEGDNVRILAAHALANDLDLASFMVMLAVDTWAERLLIPAFVYFFFQLYPPAFIASRRHRTAGAAGECVLLRPDALLRAGGLAPIRSEIIDDCALAKLIKRSGGQISLQLSAESRSFRSYGGFGGVGSMIARSAFSQLRHSYVFLSATVAGLLLLYCSPLVLLFAAAGLITKLFAAGCWLLMSVTFYPLVRFYRQPIIFSPVLPLIVLFYVGVTIYSAYVYTTGRGGLWKGRAQDFNE